jgi:hypothetical protein
MEPAPYPGIFFEILIGFSNIREIYAAEEEVPLPSHVSFEMIP